MERHRRWHQLAVAAAACALLAASLGVAMRTPHPADLANPAMQPLGEVDGEAGAIPVVRKTLVEEVPRPLSSEAEMRLEAYRATGACSLECAGFLDLYGNAWGCLVSGDGWAEVVVIRETGEDSCSVQTIHLSARG